MLEQSNNEHDIRYAGFAMRMLANTIDSILSILILLPFIVIFNKIYVIDQVQAMLATGTLKFTDISQQQKIDFFTRQLISFILQNILVAIIIITFWIYRSATPGKMILKMQIADLKTMEQPSKCQFIIRYLGYFIAILPLGLGIIWIHYDKKHQGWHDKLANTVVVYK